MQAALAAAADHFREHGYVVLDGFLPAVDLRPAQDELPLMFPSADEYHDRPDPRFAGRIFGGIDVFPFAGVEWSLLGLCPPVVALAEALLGTSAIRLYEMHNWAKYTGAVDYEQSLHRDFANHTLVVPDPAATAGSVELFVYLNDVPEDCGPTHVVSRTRTAGLPQALLRIPRGTRPEIYADEVSAAGPAGTVLAYRVDTFHRATAMTAPRGARFLLKASYRAVGDDVWVDRLAANAGIGMGEDWQRFVERATPRQLELVGFPARRHRYWTPANWDAVRERYPAADLSAFAPAAHP